MIGPDGHKLYLAAMAAFRTANTAFGHASSPGTPAFRRWQDCLRAAFDANAAYQQHLDAQRPETLPFSRPGEK